MRVLVNTIAHVGGGGITYLKNMLPRFAADEHEYVILVPEARNILEEPDDPSVWFKKVSSTFDPLPIRLLYEQILLPLRLRQLDVDVLFSPADLTPLLTSKPTLLAVRNPNPYFSASKLGLNRSASRRMKFFIQRQLTKLSGRKADHVFFVSEYSKMTSNRYLSLSESKLSTVYHGIERSLFENPAHPTNGDVQAHVEANSPYLLTVSSITEHKNYEVLFKAYDRLPANVRNEYSLLIAGSPTSEDYFESLQELIIELGIKDDVVFLGGVDYENIPYLYSEAIVYILPSKLETFGHTLVEAMASGVPVIAADSTCIPEITNGAAELFHPDDDEKLAALIEDFLGSEAKRRSFIEAGQKRAKAFSWDKTFQRTKKLLERVASETEK